MLENIVILTQIRKKFCRVEKSSNFALNINL
jgi:hypothetical protein